ncbi:MAG: hypothetical protein ACR2NS_04435 [Gemmatimonadaceae bacterium]
MSPTDWLSELDPAPPAELATAMRKALKNPTATPAAEELLEAAERLLERVLSTDCETRASALDLLTVDALVTHSLLVASTDSQAPADFAAHALARITAKWQ